MIIEFSVKNFYSIKNTQTLSFKISKKDSLDGSSFKDKNNFFNKIACIIGNNASGKTNIMKALSFLLWFAHFSYLRQDINQPIAVEPHVLSDDKTSEFTLIFVNNEVEYKYILKVNSKMVVYEYLGMKKERGYSAIYEITRSKDKDDFLKWKDLAALNKSDKDRFSARKDISMFSFLISTGHLAKISLGNNMNFYQTNLGASGYNKPDSLRMLSEIMMMLDMNDKLLDEVKNYLKSFGLDISDLKAVDINLINSENPLNKEKRRILKFVRKVNDKEFSLNFLQESEGTKNLIYLLVFVIDTLQKGGIFILDEIETSLHPYLAKQLVNIFASEKLNNNHAQLLFSTHQPLLLDDRTKTQIYIVEKNDSLETEIYRLDEVEGVRNDDNFCSKYLSGAYGGVASMRWF